MPRKGKIGSRKLRATKTRGRWLLYILRCRGGSFYTGITNDLERRLARHAAGRAARYTRSRIPVALIYQEPCGGKSQAMTREYAVKKLSRKQKQVLISNFKKSKRKKQA